MPTKESQVRVCEEVRLLTRNSADLCPVVEVTLTAGSTPGSSGWGGCLCCPWLSWGSFGASWGQQRGLSQRSGAGDRVVVVGMGVVGSPGWLVLLSDLRSGAGGPWWAFGREWSQAAQGPSAEAGNGRPPPRVLLL